MLFAEATARTRIVIASITVLLVAGGILTYVPGVSGNATWGNLAFTFMSLGFATAGTWMAMQLPVTARARTQAFLLAAGIAAYAFGDLTRMYYEIAKGIDPPYPGVSDLFYGPAMYVPLTVALWSALLSLRRLEHSARPLVIAGATSLVATTVLWFSVLAPVAADPSANLAVRGVALGYPLADVWLLMFPSIVLIMILAGFGGVPLARPWWSIATATLVLAVTDTIYSHQQVHGTYQSGGLLDMGWLVAFGMIVVGITRMLDVYTAEE